MHKHHLATVTGFAAGLAAIALVPAAAARGPQPASPEQAQALLTAPAVVASGSSSRSVTQQEALAAASRPGAVVSVAPGLTAEQAVGLAPTISTSALSSTSQRTMQRRTSVHGVLGKCTVVRVGYVALSAAHHGHHVLVRRVRRSHYVHIVDDERVAGTICSTSLDERPDHQRRDRGTRGSSTERSAGFQLPPTAIPWVSLQPEPLRRHLTECVGKYGAGRRRVRRTMIGPNDE